MGCPSPRQPSARWSAARPRRWGLLLGPGVSPSFGPLLRPAALFPRPSVPRPQWSPCAFAGLRWWSWGSPLLPPALPPPLGAPGSARPPALGAAAPVLRQPCRALVLPVPALCAPGARLDRGAEIRNPRFLDLFLTAAGICDTLSMRGPFRSFGGCPSRGIHGRQKTARPKGRAVFLCPGVSCCPGFFAAQISERSTAKPGPRSAFFPRVNNPKIVNQPFPPRCASGLLPGT